MDKQKQQLTILGGLILVLVIAVAMTIKPKKKSSAPASMASENASIVVPVVVPPVAKADTSAVAKASSDDLLAQQKNADKPWGMDPFFHSVDKEVYQGSGLVLKGISLGQGRRRYATINSDIVTVGDMIYGYRVEEIDKSKVLLKRGAESYYLVFPEQ